jgi:hypothetical protein
LEIVISNIQLVPMNCMLNFEIIENQNKHFEHLLFHILYPTEVHGENFSDLRAGVRITVNPSHGRLVSIYGSRQETTQAKRQHRSRDNTPISIPYTITQTEKDFAQKFKSLAIDISFLKIRYSVVEISFI